MSFCSSRLAFLGVAAVIGLSALSVPAAAQQPAARPIPDSLYARAQRLVNEGSADAGRALVDSLFKLTADGSDARADALFWRGTLAADAASAQRDFVTIVVSYGLSPRAADALLRLGQSEVEHADRESALRHLERLVLEHSDAPAAGEGWFWLGRARVETGDVAGGCTAFDSASAKLRADDVERRNQIAFYRQPCAALARVTPPATRDSAKTGKDTVRVARDSEHTPKDTGRRGKAPPAAVQAATHYSVQIAAYKLKADADDLARKMQARGFDAHVVTLTMYHVRIGRYAARADAAAMVARLKAQHIDSFIVGAESREP
jgi:cell division septation protein DedD